MKLVKINHRLMAPLMELKGKIQNEIQNIQLCTNYSSMCNCYYCLFAYLHQNKVDGHYVQSLME